MKKLIQPAIVVVAVLVMSAVSALPAGANTSLPEVNWLPPISNQGEFQLKDGSTLPIKFTLNDPGTGAFIEDTNVSVDVNKVLFRDDFNDGNADGWTPVSSDDISWSVVDGVLRCEPAITYPRILVDDTLEYENYIFEADARLISGKGYALLFRATDHDNFYSFQYDPGAGNKLRLSQFESPFPTYSDVADMIPYTIDYQWHHLKVAVFENNIKCYVDGNLVFSVDDEVPTLLEGGIGFRTWARASAEFDNVMVVSLPAAKTFDYGDGSDNVRISYDTMPHYIANLHTKESAMTAGDYLITVWSGSGNQLGTYLFDLTGAIQGKGRGKGKA